jgi:imidazolonepropionase-like amidohydrolase
MTEILFSNALVLDPVAGELLADRHVRVTEGRVQEISERPLKSTEARTIDLRGKVLMPGLCDAHVHVTAVSPNFAELTRLSPSYVAARASEIMRGMLMRGFTTVRDAGGADHGLARAVEEGIFIGPRILFSGHALSQTGGHGDMRAPGENSFEGCFCCAGLGRICDGITEVQRACREEIRKGATQIKLMVSGGISSPTDRIGSTQFSLEEIAAAVREAEAAEIHVMAHAYTARAVNRALSCGVRSIEHGNLMDEESAALFLKHGAFLVPTLSTYHTLARGGIEAGMPAELHAKIFDVLDAGAKALDLANRRGVKMVYGTDLLGSLHQHQLLEFAIRSEVQKPIDIIRAATCNAAELFNRVGEIGIVAPGARADLLIVDGNPLDDIGLMQDPNRNFKAIVKGGILYKNEL